MVRRVAKRKNKKRPIATNAIKVTRPMPLGPKDLGHAIMLMIESRKKIGVSGSMKREIPYLLPSFSKRSQIAEFRLYQQPTLVTTAAGTDYTTVASFTAAGYQNITELSTTFDEYRVIRGEITYSPVLFMQNATQNSVSGYCVACIDYANSGGFTSYAQADSSDNKQRFYLVGNGSQIHHPGKGVAAWPMLFEELPDQTWTLATTTSTVFCYWKPYMLGTYSPGTVTAGNLHGWMDFQFRGIGA
jgi:hypothetical protein